MPTTSSFLPGIDNGSMSTWKAVFIHSRRINQQLPKEMKKTYKKCWGSSISGWRRLSSQKFSAALPENWCLKEQLLRFLKTTHKAAMPASSSSYLSRFSSTTLLDPRGWTCHYYFEFIPSLSLSELICSLVKCFFFPHMLSGTTAKSHFTN